MNRRVFAAGILTVGTLVALLSVGMVRDKVQAEQEKAEQQAEALETLAQSIIGTEAPPFELVDLDGNTVRIADFAGQAIVLNFWATWCQPCAQEHPNLLKAAEQFQPQGVVFIGLLYDDDVQKAKDYLGWAGSGYPTVVDVGGAVADAYGVTGVPETYFINANGVIVDKVAQPMLRYEDLSRRVVAALKTTEEPEVSTEELFEPPLGPPLTDESLVLTRAQSLGEGLRCPVCRSQSVAESTSGAARTMMRQIEQLVRQGYTDEQVVDFFIDQHGDAVRLAPPMAGLGLVAWAAPIFALIAGVVVVGLFLRGRRDDQLEDSGADILTETLLADLEEDE